MSIKASVKENDVKNSTKTRRAGRASRRVAAQNYGLIDIEVVGYNVGLRTKDRGQWSALGIRCEEYETLSWCLTQSMCMGLAGAVSRLSVLDCLRFGWPSQ